MTSGKAPRIARVKPEEILATAMAAELPANCTDLCMTAVVEKGGRLDNGDPDGKGGSTKFGPAWVVEGRLKTAPVALYDSQADALALFDALVGEEGELWQRKQRRLAAIAAAEEAERAAEAAAKSGGGGSPRRKSSSEKPSGEDVRKMRRASPRLFRTTSSQPSSS